MAAIDCIQDSRQIHDVENEGCQPSCEDCDGRRRPHLLRRFKTRCVREYTRDYADMFGDASEKARSANPPIFIPDVTAIRQRCLDHIGAELRALEYRMQDRSTQESSDISRAVDLLRDMDTLVASEARRLKLEDPVYSDSRGLNVVHLDMGSESVKDFGKTGHWLMLGKDFEEGSRDVVQPREPDDLSEFQRSRIRNHFMGRGTSSPYRVWTHRTKSTIQRCVGTLKYDSNGRTAYRPIFASLWVVILTIAVLALICFYGVGIIATSTTFDPTFQKYFFWIAIIWSLASSSLLGWIIMIFGGNKRDIVAALISGLGIWLVIIQIGQTYLLTQLGIN